MSWEEKDVLDTIDSSNIFDEFEAWELKEELKTNKPVVKKNMYDYLSITAWIFSTIFWFSIFIVWGAYWYVNIQENEELDNASILAPICKVFIWNVQNINEEWNCVSISYLHKMYWDNFSTLKNLQFDDSLSLIEQIYKTENFLKSKEVVFLDSVTKNKLRPLEILNAFDKLKYNYDSSLQERIQCWEFSIDNEWILTTSCEAFSGWFEDNIRWFNGGDNDRVSGTSISVANSFLNYIEKQSEDFTLIDRQKKFKSVGIFSTFTYLTKKTSFDLTLQYNNDNLISN
jgi:hypothetical protein